MTQDELQKSVKESLEVLMDGIKDDAEEYAEETAADAAELFKKRLSGEITGEEYSRCIIALQDTPILLASSKGFETQEKLLKVLFLGLRIMGSVSGI